MVKFLRRTSSRYSKLGKGRKKKQRWKRPTGRHNKMRKKRKSYPAVVSIGHKKGERKEKTIIKNIRDLEKLKENGIAIIGNIGKRKKLEIVKKAKEKKIKIDNLNIEKFLKKNIKKEKPKETEKGKTKEKKK